MVRFQGREKIKLGGTTTMATRTALYFKKQEDETARTHKTEMRFLDDDDADMHTVVTSFGLDDADDVRVARLVLAQAVDDATSKHDDYVRTCARAYLTNPSEGLAQICLMGRINMDYLMELWTRRLGGVTPFPEDYGRLFYKELKWKKGGSNESSVPSGIHLDRPSGDIPVAPGSLSEPAEVLSGPEHAAIGA